MVFMSTVIVLTQAAKDVDHFIMGTPNKRANIALYKGMEIYTHVFSSL